MPLPALSISISVSLTERPRRAQFLVAANHVFAISVEPGGVDDRRCCLPAYLPTCLPTLIIRR